MHWKNRFFHNIFVDFISSMVHESRAKCMVIYVNADLKHICTVLVWLIVCFLVNLFIIRYHHESTSVFLLFSRNRSIFETLLPRESNSKVRVCSQYLRLKYSWLVSCKSIYSELKSICLPTFCTIANMCFCTSTIVDTKFKVQSKRN